MYSFGDHSCDHAFVVQCEDANNALRLIILTSREQEPLSCSRRMMQTLSKRCELGCLHEKHIHTEEGHHTKIEVNMRMMKQVVFPLRNAKSRRPKTPLLSNQ